MKLSPARCNFLRRSVKFLSHVISQEGVTSDPDKVEAIVNVLQSDLMESDGVMHHLLLSWYGGLPPPFC